MEHNGRLKVKFDFSFFAVVAFMIFVDTSGAAVLSLIACILHEGGHLLAMAVCGAYPERITFYGGGIALSRAGMDNLSDAKRLVILSAGCAVNLLVASVHLTMPGNDTVAVFSAVNLIICLFNALPIGYFDGAEVLEILLTKFVSLRTAEIVKRIVGIALSVVITAGVVIYCVSGGKSVSLSLIFVVFYLILAQFIG
ncbi:MAG: peptidase M50 [Ruminiclostridium sp.]|nr:peptidase M50 [Ruminiclostridium sp.]